jgi:hypothetical protein
MNSTNICLLNLNYRNIPKNLEGALKEA